MKITVKKRNLEGIDTYIPAIQVQTDEGRIANRNLPEEIQIQVEIRYASKRAKELFFKSVFGKHGEISFRSEYQSALEKCVSTIRGLEEYGITDGKTLYKHHNEAREFGDLVGDLFNEICGLNSEDELEGE